MRAPRPLQTQEILAARTAIVRGAADRESRLFALRGRPVRRARVAREWHDLLLFVRAHPYAPHIAAWADDALAELMDGLTDSLRDALANSGIATTPTRSTFSWSLVHALSRATDGTSPQLDAVEAEPHVLLETMRPLLAPVARETPDLLPDADAETVLRTMFGEDRSSWLARLVHALDAAPLGASWRSHVWTQLAVSVCVQGRAAGLTWARAPHAPPVLVPHGPQRDADVRAACAEAPPTTVPLTPRQRAALQHTMRVVLASLQRETDPVTHAETVTLHDMGRGVRIALIPLAPAVRLPFDSYVGFMAFRNGVPLAYGGAWIYPGRSKVGINVFPAMRGGESAWFFTQLLRLYHHRFGVRVFEAENYQLGHGNAEGLRSGAYWFYYRLGFVPTDGRLARVAAREFAQLQASRSYAVPRALLRELVADGLQLTLASDLIAPTDTGALTLAVQSHIATRYGGDVHAAMRVAPDRVGALLPDRRTRTSFGPAATAWCLALDAICDLERWTRRERRALASLLEAKDAPDEQRHQALLRRHTRLLDAWRSLTSAAARHR